MDFPFGALDPCRRGFERCEIDLCFLGRGGYPKIVGVVGVTEEIDERMTFDGSGGVDALQEGVAKRRSQTGEDREASILPG